MIYLYGFLVATLSIFGSILELRQSVTNYYDLVAMLMVLGGTAAVTVITMPWDLRTEIILCVNYVAKGLKRQPKVLIAEAVKIVQYKGAAEPSKLKGLAGDILRDGVELISLGFKPERIEVILGERVHQGYERLQKVSGSVRGLAKYPPAFGLVGTVLGLVSLMRPISDSASSQEIGTRMAVALVSTLYGLLMANLVLNPVGELMAKFANDERKEGEIAMQGVLLAAEDVSTLEAHEMLNSYVQKKDRLQLDMGQSVSEDDQTDAPQAGAA